MYTNTSGGITAQLWYDCQTQGTVAGGYGYYSVYIYRQQVVPLIFTVTIAQESLDMQSRFQYNTK